MLNKIAVVVDIMMFLSLLSMPEMGSPTSIKLSFHLGAYPLV